MRKFLIGRVGLLLPTLLIVSMFSFLLIKMVPGDPAEIIAGEGASTEQIEGIRGDLHLDDPFLRQYARYFVNTTQGDFGESLVISPKRDVISLIGSALPQTVSLAVLSMAFATLLGLAAGVIAALKRNTWIDHVITTLTSVGFALPPFVIGPVLVVIFAVRLGWLPAIGYVSPSEGLVEWFKPLILPAFTLAITSAAELGRQTRGALIDVLESSYVRTAEAKGLTRSRVICKHAMKNAGVPIVTVLGLQINRIIGGAVVVEAVFSIGGIGTLALSSVLLRDFPVIQALVLMTATVVCLTNVTVDASYAYFNPKLRR